MTKDEQLARIRKNLATSHTLHGGMVGAELYADDCKLLLGYLAEAESDNKGLAAALRAMPAHCAHCAEPIEGGPAKHASKPRQGAMFDTAPDALEPKR